jgi:hypothetical protein
LSKAVDGAALGAARMLNSGNPKGEATRIFNANFPAGYLGTAPAPDPTAAADFFDLKTIAASGVNVVTVTASAKLPTTFMKLANFNDLTVTSTGQATRRMVDLSLVLDVSSSIGWRWPAVRDASRAFVNAFDAANDRISLVTYGNGARVIDAMPAAHGFNKVGVMADIPNALPGGSTNMVEGLYRGWDELRAVANGQQSGLRVIVLFTDGASNSVPVTTPAPGVSRAAGATSKIFGSTADVSPVPNRRDVDTDTGGQAPAYARPFPGTRRYLCRCLSLPAGTRIIEAGDLLIPLQTAALTVNGARRPRDEARNWNPPAPALPCRGLQHQQCGQKPR